MSRIQNSASAEHVAEPSRERLAVRLSPVLKETVMRAAQIRGESLTDFVLRTISEAAWSTLREHEVMVLSERDAAAFLDALADPPEPNAALRAAAERYATQMRRV